MYNWVVIQYDEITEYHHAVPENWRHISNLAASSNDLDFMRSVGWFPVTTETADYDPTVYEISGYDYIIGKDSVTARPVLTVRPPQPVHIQAPEIERPLMDLAVLQTELQRWRDALTPDANEKLAKALIAADQQLMTDIKTSIDQFFQKMSTDPDLMHAVPADLIRQAITTKINETIDSIIDRGVSRTKIIEDWWQDLCNRIEREFCDYAKNVQDDIFSEMEKQRLLLRTALHALNIDSFPKSANDWIRYDRDIRLMATDWTQLPDVQCTMDDVTKQRWLRYRQALRDIPHRAGGGFEWPEF